MFVFVCWLWVVFGCVLVLFDCVCGKEFLFKVMLKGGMVE